MLSWKAEELKCSKSSRKEEVKKKTQLTGIAFAKKTALQTDKLLKATERAIDSPVLPVEYQWVRLEHSKAELLTSVCMPALTAQSLQSRGRECFNHSDAKRRLWTAASLRPTEVHTTRRCPLAQTTANAEEAVTNHFHRAAHSANEQHNLWAKWRCLSP